MRPNHRFGASSGRACPFVFTMVADVCSRMVQRATEVQLLEGLRIGWEGLEISHLQYADHTIFDNLIVVVCACQLVLNH